MANATVISGGGARAGLLVLPIGLRAGNWAP
jgi:hypothetical protein